MPSIPPPTKPAKANTIGEKIIVAIPPVLNVSLK
jgi:hypothetical protein